MNTQILLNRSEMKRIKDEENTSACLVGTPNNQSWEELMLSKD